MQRILEKLLLGFILITVHTICFAQDLEKNADIIIEYFETELEIISPKDARLHITKKIKVLNREGDKHAMFAEFHDSFISLIDFEGNINDKDENPVKSIKKSDLNNYSLSSYSLFDDNRIYTYTPQVNRYPYTIRYEYVIKYNGILNLRTWRPVYTDGVAVQNASLVINCPNQLGFRYKYNNVDAPNIEDDGYSSMYIWQINTIPAYRDEYFLPPFRKFTPTVHIAPNNFSLQGYSGNMETWTDFGAWIAKLNKDQDYLPLDAVMDVQEIYRKNNNKIDQIKKVYEYMQSKTRYVSIQLGIGGWKPFSAETVHDLGYGDCKALVNYTKALLKIANIDSYYTLVKAGRNTRNIITDFPHNQFNHVILCVPTKNDTIWLECTSQNLPFNYLGSFTSNRNVLLIDGDKSIITQTPTYERDQNLQRRTVYIDLNTDGNAKMNIDTYFSGLQFDKRFRLLNLYESDQNEYLYKNLSLHNFQIHNTNYKICDSIDHTLKESLDLNVNNYASKSASRLFVPLNPLNKYLNVPPDLSSRETPISIKSAYCHIDSIYIKIPPEYKMEYLPQSDSIINKFGEYYFETQQDNNLIIIKRSFKKNNGEFTNEDYSELRKFYKKVSELDKSKCVLKYTGI